MMAFDPAELKAKRLNRIKRVLAEIENNAKKATPGPWSISHSCVIKHAYKTLDGGKVVDATFDIASQPWAKGHAQFGINPQPNGSNDMRYISTVDPQRMLKLVEDIRDALGIEA
jgi:hypothetical protein